jgi:hypothetical protein
MHMGDPLKANNKKAMTLEEWKARFDGMSTTEIRKTVGGGWGSDSGTPEKGKSGRFLEDPVTGNIIDMKHAIIMGQYPDWVGDFWEWQQGVRGKASGHDPQDYFSNQLGREFYASPYSISTQYRSGYGPLPGASVSPQYYNDFATRMYNFLMNR